jgi:NAD(P)-dependent dehydrogenase (short-subunit alcohol dehydrogenase family)
MRLTPEQFAIDQTKRDPVVNADLTGRTVVVLGANTGIGYETAKHFATMNPAKLVLACRDPIRGQDALNRKFVTRFIIILASLRL